MTVTLSRDLEEFIAEKVRSGQFDSANDAVNRLLELIREQERSTTEDVEALRAELDPAIAQADRGEFVEFTAEDVIAERRAALAARRKQGA